VLFGDTQNPDAAIGEANHEIDEVWRKVRR